MPNLFDELVSDDGSGVDGKAPPPGKVVDWLHGNAELRGAAAIHHRIGTGPDDAASGDHTHDGRNSFPLFDDTDVPADLPGGATTTQIVDAINDILALLRQKSG